MDSKENLYIVLSLSALDNLYKSNVSEEELLIVKSFLTLLRQKDLLIKNGSNLSAINYKLEIKNCIDNNKDEQLKELYYGHIKLIVDSVRKTYLDSLYIIYQGISDYYIDKHAQEFFDEEVKNAFKSRKYFQTDALQPKELTAILNYFCDFKNIKDYYNPFAGLGSIAMNLPRSINYLGEEVNEKIWLLGKLRMLIYNRPETFNYQHSNSIEKWSFPSGIKYDFIGFNPPLNLKLKKSDLPFLNSEYAYPGNANSLIISECFDQLKNTGKMAFVMPSGFLFSSNRKDLQLKKELVENGHIEKVIALPERIFNFTSIAVNIIVINKKSISQRKVEFIDASEKYKTDDGKINILDDIEIFRLLSVEEDKLKRIVSSEEISKNGYNLSVNRYIYEDFNLSIGDQNNLVALKELVISTTRKTIKPEAEIKVVRIRDLANNFLESVKSFESIEAKIPKYRVSYLEDNSLLLATIWKSLKPTIYVKGEEDIYYDSSSVFVCKVNESKVDKDYLVLELQKEYVQKQLEQRSIGANISRIDRRDLFQIQVVVPDRNTQEIRKLEFKESLILKQQEKLETLKDKLGIDIDDENSFLRHKISGTLNNVIGSFSKLKDVIDNQVSKELPEVYLYKAKPTYKANLGDYLNRLERDINSINRAVRTVGKELAIRDMKFKTFDFLEFIKGYLEELRNRPNTNFEIWDETDEVALEEYKVKEISVTGDQDFLYQAFDNIIENAQRHAFTKGEEGYVEGIIEVSISYDFEVSQLELTFCNTGNPLPENFSKEAFTRKGSTSGENAGNGIGGWFINEVMKAHEGKFNIKDESERETQELGSMFPTRIDLTLPMEIKI